MQITLYIAPYLLLHQKVGIANLGVFSSKKINGFLETETNILYPPAVHIFFTEAEVLDNDFAQYISIQNNVDLTEAQLQLNNWVQNIKTELANNNTVLIEKIGSLKSQNHQIQFTSLEDAYFNQANFGFKPQQNIDLNSDNSFLNSVEEEEVEEIPLPPFKAAALQQTIASPNQPQTSTPTTQPNPPKQQIDWFWIVAIILVCFTGAMVCATFIYFPPFKTVEVLEIPLKLDDEKADSLDALQNQPDTTQAYEIIVAENLTTINAQKQLLKLKGLGIYGHLITNDSNMIVQISVAKFLQIDLAQAKLKQIQKNYYPKAYLKTTTDIN